MNPYIASVRRAWARLLLAAGLATSPAFAQHPLDPLNETEILTAAFILLNGGAAVPGAAFQGIDLREPSKASVLGFQPGNPIPRSATVFFRQNKESFRSVVNLTAGTFTPPVKIPKSE